MASKLQATISNMLKAKDSHYHLTTSIRLTTIHWYIASQRISNLPIENRDEILKFVLSCKNEDSFFGFNLGYPSSLLATLNALQIFYSLNYPYYDEAILNNLKVFMNTDGSFRNDICGEVDNRFLVSAVVILHFLYLANIEREKTAFETISFYSEKLGFNRKSNLINNNLHEGDFIKLNIKVPNDFIRKYLDRERIIRYIFECENDDGGFGPYPSAESHAANTFCCISALCTLNALDLIEEEKTNRFLVFRQTTSGGFNGRINKKEDLCYSFWVYSCLYMLGNSEFIDSNKLIDFIGKCYDDETGMYADKPGNEPDLYHTLYALIALSLLGDEKLNIVDPGFGI